MTSKPAWAWLIAWLVGLAVGVGFLALIPDTVFRLCIAAILVVNLIQLPRLAWGFDLRDDAIRLWFPLWPPANTTVARVDIADSQVVASPVRLFAYADRIRLRLTSGRTIRLSAIGTSRFGDLEAFVESRHLPSGPT